MAGVQLDDYQRQAVESEGHCLVSACPGSGKTRVLIARAKRLLEASPDNRVLAVTFTSDAAAEMTQRMTREGLAPSALSRFKAGTFHSLALGQLKKAGIVRPNQILTGGEWITLVKSTISEAIQEGVDPEATGYEDVTLAIQEIQAREKEPPKTGPEDPASFIYHLFQQYKRKSKKIDFADIIRDSITRMEAGEVAPIPGTHLLADESQDMDALQYRWIKIHGQLGNEGAGMHITLVGDDDQSIYGWRHAQGYPGMMRFKTDHDAAHVVLPVNYRCAPNILKHAKDLIERNNPDRVDKPIRAHQSIDGKIGYEYAGSAEVEFEAIMERWHQLEEDETIAYIARSNRALNDIEPYFINKKIPYYRSGGGSFLDAPDVAAAHRLVSALVAGSPKEAITHLRQALIWGGVPHRVIQSCITEHGEDLQGLLHALYHLGLKGTGAERKETAFARDVATHYQAWTRQLHRNRPEIPLGSIGLMMENYLPTQKKRFAAAKARINGFLECLIRDENEKLSRRLKSLETKLKTKQDAGARVTLLTAHASKGQEFDYVWITRAQAEEFPSDRSTDFQEERRLMYVAMTRAKKHLTLTLQPDVSPSLFLTESGVMT
ncbi:ATP-dependent helicase [Thioalkalivibrio sp. ALE16]|uniref:ATP-dependent helicase n=1 Tax=Thioalkalivibrio sp. ALE16 TaxID=1158172 RepID=UPI00035E544E|nr:ATP-dependent helicase [Thioalkalivibrio sp. ALE16]